MSYAHERDRRIIKRFGGGLTYSLRRKNSFVPGKVLTVAVAALAGLSSISLTASGGLRKNDGEAVKGATFTLAGVAGTYVVAADAPVTGNPLVLTFTPPLAGNVALGAVLTWAQPYALHTFQAMNGSAQELTDENMVAAGELVRWLLADAALPTPEAGDDLGDGTTWEAIKKVQPVGSGALPTRFKVFVGAKS